MFSSAEVAVKLRNRGSDAYKGDVYGDCISVEQRITSDGCRTCKIKNRSGKKKKKVILLTNMFFVKNKKVKTKSLLLCLQGVLSLLRRRN